MIHESEFFRDENPGIFRTSPLQVVRAASIAAANSPWGDDSNDRPGARRVVYYNDPVGGREIRLVLRMHQHLGGAWTALGSATLGAQTGSPRGRLLHSDGTMKEASAADVVTVVGALFAEYYDVKRNRQGAATAVTGLSNGDWYWVVTEGYHELRLGGSGAVVAINVGDNIVTTDDGAGNEGGRARAALTVAAGAAVAAHTPVPPNSAAAIAAHTPVPANSAAAIAALTAMSADPGDMATPSGAEIATEMNAEVDTALADIKAKTEAAIDTELAELNAAVDTVLTEMETNINTVVDTELAELNAAVDTVLTELEGNVNTAIDTVGAAIEAIVLENSPRKVIAIARATQAVENGLFAVNLIIEGRGYYDAA